MRIHEYQAKDLLRQHQVAVPRGQVASTPDGAAAVAEQLGGPVVVKAQIHAGGRGKGGGIRVASGPAEARQHAESIIGMQLVTPQTGPRGQRVRRVLVEEASTIVRELYVGITLDRARSQLVVMASQEGGMEIEEVASRHPERILREPVDPTTGLLGFQATRLAFGLGLQGAAVRQTAQLITRLYVAYEALDLSLAEINPLVVTGNGQVMALDAKLSIDDNALHRHPDLVELRDLAEEADLEVEAARHGLNYVKLDGSIGCMVNGAGLAMATMDIVKLAGGEPANFLDVGGGANAQTVEQGFRILLADPDVRAVLVNIFGGIVRCDRVAEGVIQACRSLELSVPVVVRLAGTNAEIAAGLLRDSGLRFAVAEGLQDAAQKTVAAIQ